MATPGNTEERIVEIKYKDILKHLKKSLEECSLEEDGKFVREAYDKIIRRILEASRHPDSNSSDLQENVYTEFNKGADEIINDSNRRKVENECEEIVENLKDKLDGFNLEEREFVRDTLRKINGRILKSIKDLETSRILMEQYNKQIDEIINNRTRRKMVVIKCKDILKELEDKLEGCSLKKVRKFVREAYDKITEEILVASKVPDCYNLSTYNKMYIIFNKRIDEIITNRIRQGDQSTLVACPKKRPDSFNYHQHELCLDGAIWEVFHNTQRCVHQPETYRTVLLMCVKFADGGRKCYVEQNGCKDDHAELRALDKLRNLSAKKIHMYISRSPCYAICLPRIKKFMETHNSSIKIRFSTVHYHYKPEEMKLLHELKADIGAMRREDWDHVEKHLNDESYAKLRQELGNMNGERGGTSKEDSVTTASDVTESKEDNDSKE